jgi:hypothetical protein
MVDVVKSSLRVVIDALRARRALLAEIALLRHQLVVLQRSVRRLRVTR